MNDMRHSVVLCKNDKFGVVENMIHCPHEFGNFRTQQWKLFLLHSLHHLLPPAEQGSRKSQCTTECQHQSNQICPWMGGLLPILCLSPQHYWLAHGGFLHTLNWFQALHGRSFPGAFLWHPMAPAALRSSQERMWWQITFSKGWLAPH